MRKIMNKIPAYPVCFVAEIAGGIEKLLQELEIAE
jgi:hypothetical protein